jgi:hypothetical protein
MLYQWTCPHCKRNHGPATKPEPATKPCPHCLEPGGPAEKAAMETKRPEPAKAERRG